MKTWAFITSAMLLFAAVGAGADGAVLTCGICSFAGGAFARLGWGA